MIRSNPFGLLAEDPEIEWTALRNLSVRIRQKVAELGVKLDNVQFENMVEPQKMMSEYAKPSLIRAESSIVRLIVMANNFEIKLNIIQMV